MAQDTESLESDVLQTLDAFTEILDRHKIDYAIIGGIAVFMRSRPRYTQDVDVLLQVPQVSLAALTDDLKLRGFTIDPILFIREYVDLGMTGFQNGDVQVDCLKPVVPLYAKVLQTATEIVRSSDRKVRVATPEGLILTKLISFRSQDQQDIFTLLTTHRGKLDLQLIRDEWQPLADSYPEATKWFEGMLAKYSN